MRFHVLGVPHTVTHTDYVACAFTQKVLKFCKMMTKLGHEVIHYGHADSNVICTEHVTITNNTDLALSYGNRDWRKNVFKYTRKDHVYQIFEKNAITEIDKRKKKFDFILAFFGLVHQNICDAFDRRWYIPVEPGIGYNEVFAPCKVFESYAIYHAITGPTVVDPSTNTVNLPNWYDAVIPNYFDPDDFIFNENKENYFLYLGRIVTGKGVDIAIDVTKEIGAKLIIAGQIPNLEEDSDDPFVKLILQNLPSHVEYVGYADLEKRKHLMANAKAGFVPSIYIEPFGGVQIEMLMSGTPTITSDWGAFAENNLHGVTGYRCRTFDQFVWAAQNIEKIESKKCREWAENFTLDKIGLMYEDYFESVQNYYKYQSWYKTDKKRNNLDWLNKNYPKSTFG